MWGREREERGRERNCKKREKTRKQLGFQLLVCPCEQMASFEKTIPAQSGDRRLTSCSNPLPATFPASMCPLPALILSHYETACVMLSNRNNPLEMEHPIYCRPVHMGRKMAGAANINGRFRMTTRQYSGRSRAAPGTERYRHTEMHRRFNKDMNSASVSLFSTRKRGKGKANKRQCSLLLVSSQLLMYSLLSRGEEHSSHAQFLTEIACV